MYVCVYSWLKITSSNSSFYLEKMHIISIQKNYQNNIWFWLVYHHQLSNYATNMFQSIHKYSLFLYISKINIRKLCVKSFDFELYHNWRFNSTAKMPVSSGSSILQHSFRFFIQYSHSIKQMNSIILQQRDYAMAS